jgi:hypothetical protein
MISSNKTNKEERMRGMAMAILTAGALAAFAGAAEARQVEGPEAARHAHRAKLIEERKARGPEVRQERANADSGNSFWKREGERSGLGKAGGRVGDFIRGLNPAPFFSEQGRKYEERKGASQK